MESIRLDEEHASKACSTERCSGFESLAFRLTRKRTNRKVLRVRPPHLPPHDEARQSSRGIPRCPCATRAEVTRSRALDSREQGTVAELVDALRSGRSELTLVGVRLPPVPPPSPAGEIHGEYADWCWHLAVNQARKSPASPLPPVHVGGHERRLQAGRKADGRFDSFTLHL